VTKLDLGPGYPESVDGLAYRPCVGIMLINRDGKVWVGSRSPEANKNGYDYKWQMPQGGIDAGETPEEAARRELYEETSIHSVTLLEEAPEWFAYDYPEEFVAFEPEGQVSGAGSTLACVPV
jgi:putative (di)nucleoside polyphosphate hydrolase